MPITLRDQAALEREANSIERVLAALALPVRVRGGEIREGRVHFQLSGQARGKRRELQGALGAVAAALGAPRVELAQRGTHWALEVEPPPEDSLRLLPLLDLLGRLPPLHIALGMGLNGRPLVIDLTGPSSWNLLVVGQAGCGKSELLRSALVSLAFGAAPREVRVLGIDLSGRELRLLEAMPHALCELADEVRYADELLRWLVGETLERRHPRPHLLLWVDDLGVLAAAGLPQLDRRLRTLLRDGPAAGVHLMLGSRPESAAGLMDLGRDRSVQAQAGEGEPGRFLFSSLRGRREAKVAWLPVRDLYSAARLVEAQWLGAGAHDPGWDGWPSERERA